MTLTLSLTLSLTLGTLLSGIWDGVTPALLSSVFQGSVFWAVKDVTRRESLAWLGLVPAAQARLRLRLRLRVRVPPPRVTLRVPPPNPNPILIPNPNPTQGTVLRSLATPPAVTPPLPDWAVAANLDWRTIATLVAVFTGEVAYWLVRSPTEVVKVAAQAQGPTGPTVGAAQEGSLLRRGPGGRASPPQEGSEASAALAAARSAVLAVLPTRANVVAGVAAFPVPYP